MIAYPPPGTEERTDWPGALRSGLRVSAGKPNPTGLGPREEKLAMTSALVVAPTPSVLS